MYALPRYSWGVEVQDLMHVDELHFGFVPAAGLYNVAILAVAAAAAKIHFAEQIAEGLSRFKGAHSDRSSSRGSDSRH